MLKGIKVLQFQGLAPTVFCGMYFADQGAQVILIARKDPAPFSMPIESNLMNRGKKCVVLSPKIGKDRQMIQQLIKISDIIIDPYRPGVLEKLKLGPEFIFKVNKKAVVLRVSGYGQSGPMAQRPGHDLNYISSSGIVPLINGSQNKQQIYQFPTNYLADFVSCSLGITASLSALAISKNTGIGRVVDCSMTDGCKYYSKIIKQVYQLPSKSVPKTNIEFINFGSNRYCVNSDVKDSKKVQQLIKQMQNQNKQYLKIQQLQISKVKELSQIQESLIGLRNPFADRYNEKLTIPKRGEDTQKISELVRKSQIQKSKL